MDYTIILPVALFLGAHTGAQLWWGGKITKTAHFLEVIIDKQDERITRIEDHLLERQ